MIIEEYDESLFISRFEDYKRVETSENPNGNFSYRGLRALFNYIDESHEEDNPYKLDVIALCCEYSEYKNLEEYLNDYSEQHTIKEDEEDEEYLNIIWEEIQEKTSIILLRDDLNDGFIIAKF